MRDRLIDLDGPANFRDLGGYETREGRWVRSGRVFRSDSLSYMSDADVAHVVEVLGLRTVIDLRAGHEVDEFSHGPLEAEGVVFHHLPIIDETREPPDAVRDAERDRPIGLDEIYLLMLEHFGPRFAAVLRVIARAEDHPLVFHCAAGKDRTGLVAALVLGLLDVDSDIVAADYAMTAERMPVMIERHRDRRDRHGVGVEVAEQHYEARADAMHAVLDHLVATHGSVERYVLAEGVTPASIAALRAALLE